MFPLSEGRSHPGGPSITKSDAPQRRGPDSFQQDFHPRYIPSVRRKRFQLMLPVSMMQDNRPVILP